MPETIAVVAPGRRHLPEALRSCGLVVHTIASAYDEEAPQWLADERCLRDAGAKAGSS
jgi:hypothetical protein